MRKYKVPKERYDNKNVNCPFFVSETANAIKCEGVICSQQLNIFRSSNEKRIYKHNYCVHRYCDCKHFVEVDEKYR